MFDMEKKMEFVRSLAGSKADQFQGMIREGMAGGSETLSAVMDDSERTIAETARRAPDMVLAESNEDIGTQLDDGGIENTRESIPGRDSFSEAISSQMRPSHPGEFSPSGTEILSDRGVAISHTATSEIMKKKLNHFQIEKLAETLKQRLDTELKIQKERWGEEP